MADQLIQQAQDIFEGQIVRTTSSLRRVGPNEGTTQDFEGQKLAEKFSNIILTITAVRSSCRSKFDPGYRVADFLSDTWSCPWLLPTEHLDYPMGRIRWYRSNILCCRTPLANLQ